MSFGSEVGLVQPLALHFTGRIALGTLVVFGCQVTPPVREASPTPEILRRIQDAVGADQLFSEREGLTFLGQRVFANPAGLSSAVPGPQPVTLSFRPAGPFLVSVGGERTSITKGFDGRTAWSRDASGVTRELSLGARSSQLTDGWLRTQLWLTPGGASLEAVRDKALSTDAETVLRLRRLDDPKGVSDAAVVRVDRRSSRPLSFTSSRNGRERAISFGDWRLTDGVWFPHEMTESVDGITLHTDRFLSRTRGTPPTFEAPSGSAEDSYFDDVGGTVQERIEARIDAGGRFYVGAKIDGRGELWMLLDTGFGSHAVHTELAEELGVVSGQTASLQGVSGTSTGNWCVASSLSVGRWSQRSPRMVTVDTTFLSSRAGFPVAGVLGAPLFERAVVVLDEPRGRVILEDPVRARRRRSVTWMPVVFDGNAPCVSGHIVHDGQTTRAVWFRIDTGSDDTVTVSRWAAQEFDLVGDRAGLRTTRIEGAFGTVLGWRKSVDEIQLGDPMAPGLRFHQPEVTLLREGEAGPLSDPWIAGNLGTRSMRGCRVTFDLPRSRMAIESEDSGGR